MIREDFLDEGEFMLCPFMVYGGRHSSILWAGMVRAKAQGWDIRQKGQAGACMLANVASTTIFTELLGRQDKSGMLGLWAIGNVSYYGTGFWSPTNMTWNLSCR